MTAREILGVGPDASLDDCKAAYRRLCYELHPDRTGNDPRKTDRFKDVNRAWEEIQDPSSALPIEERNPPASPFARGFTADSLGNIFSETLRKKVVRESPQDTIAEVINFARDPSAILQDLAEEIDRRGGLATVINGIFGKAKTER